MKRSPTPSNDMREVQEALADRRRHRGTLPPRTPSGAFLPESWRSSPSAATAQSAAPPAVSDLHPASADGPEQGSTLSDYPTTLPPIALDAGFRTYPFCLRCSLISLGAGFAAGALTVGVMWAMVELARYVRQ